MSQLVWFTEVHLRVTLPVGHRYVSQLTVDQTPGSTVTEQSVHPASVWLHRLSSRRPVDKCLEPRLRSPGGVSAQLPGVKPHHGAARLHLPGAERHAHRRWRGVVQPQQLYLGSGPLLLQEETTWIHQTVRFRWDYTVLYRTYRGHHVGLL